jgi:hypothetical protein
MLGVSTTWPQSFPSCASFCLSLVCDPRAQFLQMLCRSLCPFLLLSSRSSTFSLQSMLEGSWTTLVMNCELVDCLCFVCSPIVFCVPIHLFYQSHSSFPFSFRLLMFNPIINSFNFNKYLMFVYRYAP